MTADALPALFPEEDIAVIVQDVLDCCDGLIRPGPKSKRPEEDLSQQVFKKLVRVRRYRIGPLEPHIESWLPDAAHRADIRFSCGRGIECHFLFEAKRLFVTFPKAGKSSLVSEYIHEGMMRFISRRYAPYQRSSAMLGYVHDETLDIAKEKLAESVHRNQKSLMMKDALQPSRLRVLPSILETRHQLSDADFTLYHLLIAVPTVSRF